MTTVFAVFATPTEEYDGPAVPELCGLYRNRKDATAAVADLLLVPHSFLDDACAWSRVNVQEMPVL